MLSENVPAWAREKAHRITCATYIADFGADPMVDAIARALASAHAAGEEKGRMEMREDAVRVAESRAAMLPRGEPKFQVAATALILRTLAVQSNIPPTPNPLPATGGEEKSPCPPKKNANP